MTDRLFTLFGLLAAVLVVAGVTLATLYVTGQLT